MQGVCCSAPVHWQSWPLCSSSLKIREDAGAISITKYWYPYCMCNTLSLALLVAKLRVGVLVTALEFCWCWIEAMCLVTSLSPWCPQLRALKQTVHWKEYWSFFTGLIHGHFFCQHAWNADLYAAAPVNFLVELLCWPLPSLGTFGEGTDIYLLCVANLFLTVSHWALFTLYHR